MWGYENFEFKHAADEAGFSSFAALYTGFAGGFFSFRKRTFLAGRSGGNRGAGHQTSGKTEEEKNTLLVVDWRCYSKEGEVPQHFLGHKEYSISSFFVVEVVYSQAESWR